MINYSLKQEVFIEKYFRLGPQSSKGWRNNISGCPYCNDGRSKNPRSHFIFRHDGFGWQCFNCNGKHRFNENNIKSFATFVSKASWKKVGGILLEIKKDKIFPEYSFKNQEDLKEEVGEDNLELIDYKEIELPSVSMPMNMKVSEIAPRYRDKFKENIKKVNTYLKEHGLLDAPETKKLFICMDGDCSNRLIFPIYFDGKLISWAARALFPTSTKYLYPPSDEDHNERGKIIYGLDKLFKSENVKQIFVTESLVDSFVLGGMAVLSKNITDDQIAILKHFNFQKKKMLFVLDKDEINYKWDKDLKGIDLGQEVLKAGQENWVVSYPKFSRPAKDVGESYNQFGWLETYDKIMSGVVKNGTDLTLKSRLVNVDVGKRRRKLTKM